MTGNWPLSDIESFLRMGVVGIGTLEPKQPLQQMIKRELANYESQIINIGKAKVKQL